MAAFFHTTFELLFARLLYIFNLRLVFILAFVCLFACLLVPALLCIANSRLKRRCAGLRRQLRFLSTLANCFICSWRLATCVAITTRKLPPLANCVGEAPLAILPIATLDVNKLRAQNTKTQNQKQANKNNKLCLH